MKKLKFLFILCCLIMSGCASDNDSKDSSEKANNHTEENEKGSKKESESKVEKESSATNETSTEDNQKEEIKVSPQLSDDIKSFQVQIDKDFYQFPMDYDDFVDKGWEINEKYYDGDKMLSSNCVANVWFDMNDISVYVYIYNPDNSIQSFENCVIAGLSVDVEFEAKGTTVYIPGQFKLGASTMDEVMNKFGKPDYEYEGETMSSCKYEMDDAWSNAELTFNDQGVLKKYKVENPVATDDYVYSEAVDIENEYTEPKEMTGNLEDCIVNFGGDLYQLPVPVSAFLDNGWKIEDTGLTVDSYSYKRIDLERDGVKFSPLVYNYTENACNVEDAVIYKISSNDIWEGIFEVSGGINMQMSEEDVKSIVETNGYTYKIDETSYSIKYHIDMNNSDYADYCTVAFEGGKVSYIVISLSK